MLQLAVHALLLLTAIEPVEPQVQPLPDAEAITFPADRTAAGFHLPIHAYSGEDLDAAAVSLEPLLGSLPEASRSGIDGDAVPYHLGLSLHALPARFTGVYLEGLRIASDSDFSGTNLDLLPAGLLDGLEVTAGPAAALAGGHAAAGALNLRLAGAGRFPDGSSGGSIRALAGTDGLVGTLLSYRAEGDVHGVDVMGARVYGNIGAGLAYPCRRDVLGMRWRLKAASGANEYGLFDALVLGSQGVYDTSDDDWLAWKVSLLPPRAAFVPLSAYVGGYQYERTLRGHMLPEEYGNFQFRARLEEYVVGAHTLSATAWYTSERVERFGMWEETRSLTGISVMDELALGGDWSGSAAAVVERSSDGADVESGYHAAAVWHSDGAFLRLGFQHGYRFPSLVPKYEGLTDMGDWWRQGNPLLSPERFDMLLMEAGNRLGSRLSVRGFFSRGWLENLHHLEPTGGTGPDGDPIYRWSDDSGGGTLAAGGVLAGACARIQWELSYTNRWAADDNGAPPAWLERNVLRLSLAGPLGSKAAVSIAGRTVIDGTGPRLEDDWGVDIAPYTLLDAGIQWRPKENLTWHLVVSNVLDEEVEIYEYEYRDAVRPRSLALSFEYRF